MSASAPTPANEPQRIAALRAFDILDSAEEEIYDEITAAAADACSTPISLLSFLDSERQWCKSHHGVSWNSTARTESFCAYTVCSDEIFTVEDTLKDIRFRDNPLVLKENGIRFYAGIPLKTTEGHNVGTLCVLDTVPRRLNGAQVAILRKLSDSAMRMLRLRSIAGSAVFAAAVNLASDAIAIADAASPGRTIIYANRSFLDMTSRKYHEVIGLPFTYPCTGKALQQLDAALRERRSETVECELELEHGRKLNDRVTQIPYLSENSEPLYTVVVHRDITLQKEAEVQHQHLHAMRTTVRTVNHVVFNFMNAAALFRQQTEGLLDARKLQPFDAALQNTKAQLSEIAEMPEFKERPTPFGFTLLDPGD